MNYATVKDMAILWRPLAQSETERAEALLANVSALLRLAAKDVGKDLDAMISANSDMREAAKSVTVDIVARALMTSTSQEPMTQFSQAAGGYTASGTFLVPGGGIFIKKSELARLGLRKQRVGAISVYD